MPGHRIHMLLGALALIALAPAGRAETAAPVPDYRADVRPVLARRCVVCHGCYDAPCQLKLGAHAGLTRGGSKERVYDGGRLREQAPSRLFRDVTATEDWRERGFHAVLGMRNESETGVMARILALRREQPLPDGPVLPDSFDFSLEREQYCPAPEEFDEFAARHPLWSMPYGLPDLPQAEYGLLQRWLAAGGPDSSPETLPAAVTDAVASWEALLNGDALRTRLVARYLYEHLFLAHLYFGDGITRDAPVFFRLVRSRTPPGEPIDVIATRRPYEDPDVARVWYRLWRDPLTVVDKTHMPYRLDAARREKWQRWFFDAAFEVTALPGYDIATAANPFITFQAIPPGARHRFLLDEARFTIMNFIKGPVCRGAIALNVIQDRFWVFFTRPDLLASRAYADFLAAQDRHLRLPAESDSALWSITHWRRYDQAQQTYLRAKLDFIHDNHEAFERGKLGVVWDGDGHNPNAALTVFRHHDSATVVPGLVGRPPLTAWVIDYPILERIHYLLVAGYDVYGSASHQAMTRLYMDFLRMEAEMNFLAFLPPQTRRDEITRWYRDATEEVADYVEVYFEQEVIAPLYDHYGVAPKLELFERLAAHLQPALGNSDYALAASGLPAAAVEALGGLMNLRGRAAALVPQTVFVNVPGHGALTLLSDSAYTNISSMFLEDLRRLPADDRLTVVNGLLGAYPDMLLEVDAGSLAAFAGAVERLRDPDDWSRLLDDYGVRRTDPRFWTVSDALHAKQRAARPLEASIFDFSRLDNR